MRYLFLLLTTFFCSLHGYQVPNYEKIADKITAKTAKRLEAKENLRLVGTGGGMMDHVRMMAMSFDCFHELTIEEGRELLIHCVDEYLLGVNSNKEIRPHLNNYPFNPKNIEIWIFIYNPDGSKVSSGRLSFITSTLQLLAA